MLVNWSNQELFRYVDFSAYVSPLIFSSLLMLNKHFERNKKKSLVGENNYRCDKKF